MEKIEIDPQHKLSASSINTFLSCPLKFKFRYVDRVDAPSDSPHLIYGTAVHKAIEEFHKSIWHGQRFEQRKMQQIFLSSWEMGVELNEIPVKWYRASSQKEMTQAGITSIKNYYSVHKDDPPPANAYDIIGNGERIAMPAVELYFTLSLADLINRDDWYVSGVIDLIAPTPNGNFAVIDHKTGSQKYSDFKVKTDLQLAIYAYAFRQLCKMGYFPGLLESDKEEYVMFDIISKKKPIIYYHKRKITGATFNHLAYIIETIIAQIEREEFLPNYGQECSGFGGCDFLKLCGSFKY